MIYAQAFLPEPNAGTAGISARFLPAKGAVGFPRWREDGKELYYITKTEMMVLKVSTRLVWQLKYIA